MLTFDKLQSIFERGRKPYWVLYKGNSKGTQIGSNCTTTDEKPSLDDAWADLSEILNNYGDGVYTLECRTSPQTSRGNDLHTFMVGNVEEKQIGRASNTAFNHPAIGFFQGLDAKFFMDQINGANTNMQTLQIELLKKDMEIQNLKRDLKEKRDKVTPADRIFGILEKNPQIIDKVLSGNATAAVGLLKADQPIPASDVEDDSEDDGEGYEPGRIDLNAIVEAAARIQKALPSAHVNDVFDGLATWVEKDPQTAANYLKMML